MCDPITAVFGFLEKCAKPAADAATYFYKKRRQEKELIEVVWKDVIEALATRHLPQKFIENPGHFDIFDNETTQLKYGKSWKVAEVNTEYGPRYRVSLLILGVISRNLKSKSSVRSFISSVLGDCGFDPSAPVAPPGGDSYVGRSYGMLYKKVLGQMAKDVRRLPSSVIVKLNSLAIDDQPWPATEKDFNNLEEEIEAALLEKKEQWTQVFVPGDQFRIATGRLPKQYGDDRDSDREETRILVPKDKETNEILWILSGAMKIGHTLDHTKQVGIEACRLCHSPSNTVKQVRKAIWHAFLPGRHGAGK